MTYGLHDICIGRTRAPVLACAFYVTKGLPIYVKTINEREKFGRMTNAATQKVESKPKQKEASPSEIDEALRCVMNTQQYNDFLVIRKALEEEMSAGSRSQPNSDGKHDQAWDRSPDAIRLRLIKDAIAKRSGR